MQHSVASGAKQTWSRIYDGATAPVFQCFDFGDYSFVFGIWLTGDA
jgi:hypothetical protein